MESWLPVLRPIYLGFLSHPLFLSNLQSCSDGYPCISFQGPLLYADVQQFTIPECASWWTDTIINLDSTEFYHIPHISQQSLLEGPRVLCEGHQVLCKLELVFLFCPKNKTVSLLIMTSTLRTVTKFLTNKNQRTKHKSCYLFLLSFLSTFLLFFLQNSIRNY